MGAARRRPPGSIQIVPPQTGGSLLTFGHDAYGNLTTDYEAGTSPPIGYAYDLGDRLTRIVPPSGPAATFAYDALGRIRTKVLATTPSGTTETYRYAGTSETVVGIATSGDSSSTLGAITDADGTRLGAQVGADVRWFLPDLHGSNAALLAKDEASILDATRYDGYGLIVDQTASPSAGARAWKYQGRLDLSPAQGTTDVLYEMGARAYSPALGAFTSLDTVAGSAQDPLSMNRYLYALANPATLIDPTGHAGCDGSGRRSAAAGGKPCPSTGQHNATPSPTTTDTTGGTSPAGTPGSPQQATPRPADRLVFNVPVDSHGRPYAEADASLLYAYCSDTGLGLSDPASWGAACAGYRTWLEGQPTIDLVGATRDTIVGAGEAGWDLTGGFVGSLVNDPVGTLTAPIRMAATAAGRCLDNLRCIDDLKRGANYLAAQPGSEQVRFWVNVTVAGVSLYGSITALPSAARSLAGLRAGAGAAAAEAPALDPVAAARAQVQAATDAVAARGVALTPRQAGAVAANAGNPGLLKAFQGYNFHQEVARLLQGTFNYRYRGIDFVEINTGIQIELTTSGQVLVHLNRYSWLTPDQIVTYTLP